MMFKLTKEQVNYIIDMYGGSKSIIEKVEQKLNFINIIEDEDLYLEIVIAVVSQLETIKFNKKRCVTKEDMINNRLSMNKIIETELKRRCNDINYSEDEIMKIIKFKKQ